MESNNNPQQPQDNKPRHHFRRNVEENKTDSNPTEKPYRRYNKEKGQDESEKAHQGRTREMRGTGVNFTHFFSLPLNTVEFKLSAQSYMDQVLGQMSPNLHKHFDKQGLDTIHITLSMLSLEDDKLKQLAMAIFKEKEAEIIKIIGSDPFHIAFDHVSAFWYRESGNKIPRVIYISLKKDQNTEKLNQICNLLITEMIANGIVNTKDLGKMCVEHNKETNMYTPQNYHVTLFRVKNHEDLHQVNFQELFQKCQQTDTVVHHVKRIDISTRYFYDSDGFYRPLSTFLLV